jgi:cell division protein FtsB
LKALTLIFVVLIALLQYPLWLGKGSWLRVWDLSHQLAQQQEKNNALKARNDTLDAEVRDLKSGRAAIEERARSELGMVKQDEVFYQVLEGPMPVIAPPVTPVAPKTDTPIVVKVPSKNATATLSSSHKSAVSPSAASPSPVAKDIASKDRVPKENVPKEETSQEKSKLSSPLNPSPQIEAVPTKKAEEKPKAAEKPKAKLAEGDAIEAAKSVLKQQ